MIAKVIASDRSKMLITSVVKDLQSKKPSNKHVDYLVSVGKCELLTDENANVLRNVSILYLKGIQAAIGNKTGNILIIKKPLLLSIKKTTDRIYSFLDSLQPERFKRIKARKSKITPVFSQIYDIVESEGKNIKRKITGSNNTNSSECIEEFKTL